jgi:hypothetical protein
MNTLKELIELISEDMHKKLASQHKAQRNHLSQAIDIISHYQEINVSEAAKDFVVEYCVEK